MGLAGCKVGLRGSHSRADERGRGVYSVSRARAASLPGRQQSAGSEPASDASACCARSGLGGRGEGGVVRVGLYPTSAAPFLPLGSTPPYRDTVVRHGVMSLTA